MDIYHQTEDQKAEAILKYLKENKRTIILSILIFTLGFFGVRYYRHHTAVVSERASMEFSKMFQSEINKDYVSVETYAKKLKNEYKGSPYADMAAMRLAKLAIVNNDLTRAKENLGWVLQNGKNNKPLYHIALLRLARIYRHEGNYEQALKLLNKDPDGFAALYEEIKGDIYLEQKNVKAAHKSYSRALDLAPKTGSTPWLRYKLMDLVGLENERGKELSLKDTD